MRCARAASLNLLLATVLTAPIGAQDTHPAQARWEGVIILPSVELPLVLHLVQADGVWGGSLDSPAQAVVGIELTQAGVDEDGTVRWGAASIGARWEGRLEGDQLVGTFFQGGGEIALTLSRSEEAPRGPGSANTRPQTPQAPFPYSAEDLRFPSLDGSFELAGTLTIPEGAGPHPAVVLITGSGAQDRNETLAGHQPFLVLADHLSRSGIAVLRVDDRGTAESGGVFATSNTEDFADDVEAAVRLLLSRPEIDADHVGLVGHSEGGVIGPMVAVRNDNVDFVVMLAGTGVTGEAILLDQAARIISASASEEVATFNTSIQEVIFDAAREGGTASERRTRITDRLTTFLADADPADRALLGIPDQASAWIAQQAAGVTAPWMSWFIAWDPAPTLTQLTVPVLALFGDRDLQVHPDANAPAVRTALAGNPQASVVVLPGLNHLFQEAETGNPSEYASIEQTMSPVALERIASWIQSVVR